MRAAAIILLALAVLVTGNFAVSAFYPPYRAYLKEARSNLLASDRTIAPATPPATIGDAELAASIERMTAGIEAIVGSGAASTASGAVSVASVIHSGAVAASGATASGTASVPNATAPEYPLSGVLLARLMPEVFPKKIENKGIFNIYLFDEDHLLGSTYWDEKSKTKFFVFTESYHTMLTNLKLVPQAYKANETDTFFDSTFFLNSTNKKDASIRFVFELEGKAVGVETPKAYYPKMKKMLLQQ